jgi:putative ABC transport system permease protein
MRTIRRATKALIRSPLRGALLVGVLAVSIGLALIMITVNGAFAQRLDDIRASVGTDITVRPAGSFGGGAFSFRRADGGGSFGGQVQPSPTPAAGSSDDTTAQPTIGDDDLQQLTSIANIASITRVVTNVYTGDTLKAGTVTPPNGQGGSGPTFTGPDGQARSFTPPIIVTGTDDPNTLASLISGDTTVTSGRSFTEDDAGKDVAVIGQAIADANSLAVGDTFVLNNQDSDGNDTGTTTTVTVIGIYTTGTTFGDNAIALPIDTARAVFGRDNNVDQAIVKANSVDNVDQVATDVKNALGTDKADVTTAESTFASISAPLSDAKSSSEVGMWAALVASAIIILFSIGLVARQRIREIGILKAVGASSWNVVSQFSVETAAIAIGAALLGAIATFPLAQTVANGLVSDPTTGTGRTLGPGGGGGGRFFVSGGTVAANRASTLLGSVDVAVSPEVFLYALAIAVGLAMLAAIVPAWYVGRVRPAEVLRHE